MKPMSRSLTLREEFIAKVKMRVKHIFPRQKNLAEELGLSLATISNFLNGKPVDHLNFLEICDRLSLPWQDIAKWGEMNNNFDSFFETVSNYAEDEGDEPFIYVERPPMESNFLEEILRPGGLIRIKAPCLMGKTALASKIIEQAAQKGYRYAHLNFHLATDEQLSDLSTFLKWFCAAVGHSLELPNTLKNYWNEELYPSKIICTKYFEQYLLAKSHVPLVICLDEVERLFPHPQVASEFLGLLRAWHEKSNVSEIWRRLRLVVVHSTEVYIPLNLNESPFNVGLAIDLPDFTPGQVQELSLRYKLNLRKDQIHSLMELVGGHPDLIRLAFMTLKQDPSQTLEKILAVASTEEGIYKGHLRHLWNLIQKSPDLVSVLVKVMFASASLQLPASPFTFQLMSLGVVDAVENRFRPRYRLYQEYFQGLLKPLIVD
jgi:transcriptional regulator with XRE-family HTH domain